MTVIIGEIFTGSVGYVNAVTVLIQKGDKNAKILRRNRRTSDEKLIWLFLP
jgi:ribosomal protein S28E/S33